MALFAIGNAVLNLTSQVARVVGHHANGDPILKSLRADGKTYGGKWLADPAKTRLLTPDELQRFYRTGRIDAPVTSLSRAEAIRLQPVKGFLR